MKHVFFIAFVAGLLCVSLTRKVQAESLVCTEITSVPYAINLPGIYCLSKDINMTSNASAAITINANNVALDCNGHELTRYSPSTASYGIVSTKKRRVEVRNCAFNLFPTGIAIVNTPATKILGNTISKADLGILATGEGIEIVDNIITGIYGSSGKASNGIQVGVASIGQTGASVRIIRNRLYRLDGAAISVKGNEIAEISGNFIYARDGIRIGGSDDDPNTSVFGKAVILENVINVFSGDAVAIEPQQYGMCSGNYINGKANSIVNCQSDARGNTFLQPL